MFKRGFGPAFLFAARMKYHDYYKTLGVNRDATPEAIKRVYRKLARKYHPDVSDEPQAEARFKEVGEAYEVLKDPEKRAAYDNLGSNWRAGQEFTPPPGWSPGAGFETAFSGGAFDFSDFFGELFGGAGPQSGGFHRTASFTRHGRDERVRVRISLEDAYLGAERNLQLQAEPLGGGSRSRTLRVKIPSGVTNGQQIRLSGQGAPGVKGGRAGNLFLQVDLLPHPVYRVEGKDLHMDLPVSPWEAALGATIKIPTLGGNKDLKVPAGSQSGRTLRLRGRGLGQAQKGDLYVHVQIVTPAADTPEAKALYQKMASELAFNPRAKLNV